MPIPGLSSAELLRKPRATLGLFALALVNVFAPGKWAGELSYQNQNALSTLVGLFDFGRWNDFFVHASLLLLLGSLLEQKVRGKWLWGIYVGGGLVGLLLSLPFYSGTHYAIPVHVFALYSISGATWLSYRNFKLRLKINKNSRRLKKYQYVEVPHLVLGCVMLLLSWSFFKQRPFLDLIGATLSFSLGAFVFLWKHKTRHQTTWPWISDDEYQMFYETKQLGFEERFGTLRKLSLSNFSNPKTWSEWLKLSLKYPNEKALNEICYYFYDQMIEHSRTDIGRKLWLEVLDERQNDVSFDSFLSRLASTEALRIADLALESGYSALAMRILLSPSIQMDLHWVVNVWVRRLKRKEFKEEIKANAFAELQKLHQCQVLPSPFLKLKELLELDVQTLKKAA